MDGIDRWRPTLVVYNPLKAGSIDGTDTVPHDRAIVRAMNAKLKPNKELRSDPECTIFVGRLSKNTIENDLQNFFKKFGEIVSVHLIRDIVTGFSKCYAFIEYAERRDARDAQRANGARIDDKEVMVEMECGRTMKGWVPRRLGGGFSGKKESGQLRFGGNQRPFKRPYALMQNHNRGPREEFGTPYSEKTFRTGLQPREPRPDIITVGRPHPPPVHDSRPSQFPDRGRFRDRSGQRDDDRSSRSRDRVPPSRFETDDRQERFSRAGSERAGERYENTTTDKFTSDWSRSRETSRSREHKRPDERRETWR